MVLRWLVIPFTVATLALAAEPGATKADQDKASPAPAAKADANSTDTATPQTGHRRIAFGGVMVNAGYSHFSGGYPYWGYGPYWGYDPLLWTPYYYPGYWNGFAYGPNMGDVKIQAQNKSALVYLDGALAGRVEQLKDMWLQPGAYSLEIRDSNRRLTQKIYVLSGKKLKVTPEMMTEETRP